MGATPADAAAAPAAFAAGGTRTYPRRLHLARLALGSLALLVAVVAVAYGLAAARLPQHRAALEDLIRHETGLEVRFSELTVGWGWYGPEAVFHDVGLAEPDGAVRLSAPRLSVALDLWRMLRSGRIEAGRITLQHPDIDLTAGAATRAAGAARADVPGAGTGILSRWRGGQIDIESGTLHTALPGGTVPVAFGIRRAQLRRLAGEWLADVQLLLPATLGAGVRVTMQMRGDPAFPAGSSGRLSVQGRSIEFAGWRALALGPQVDRYLPQGGSGDLEVHATVAHGQLLQADGSIRAQALEWRAPTAATAAVLALQRLHGDWQVVRRGAEWHLSVRAPELGVPAPLPESTPAVASMPAAAPAPATLTLDVAADGSYARGHARHSPLAVLTALTRWFAPQLPLGELGVGGEARELTFDWSARRPVGTRLVTSADLRDMTLTSVAHDVTLTGLSGALSGSDTTLVVDLRAGAARLSRVGEPSAALDQLEVLAHLRAVAAASGGWQLSTEDLRMRRAGLSLAASGAISADTPRAPRLINAHVALKDAELVVLANLLGPRVLNALGAAATHVTSGRIDDADFTWRGPLGDKPAWSAPGAQFSGTVVLRDASLTAGDEWPEGTGIDAHLEWRGPHVHAAIYRAQSGSFRLNGASADWDARAGQAARFTARLAGNAQEALAWLRTHAQVAAWAPAVGGIDLRGGVLLDLDVMVPAAAAGTARHARARIAALLDGGELRPVSGVPPLGALRGTLVFAGGQLQRSTLTGQWLGGPVTLGVAQHREPGTAVLAISGRGVMAARQAVQAAGGNADQVPLSGKAEWSALLTVVPGTDAQHARWQLHADSSLVGVASRLPEPFAKAPGAVLPVHLDLRAGSESGQLHVSFGERLVAVAALSRSGDTWRIERGAIRLAGNAPALPPQAVMLLDGRVSQLDLAACLALWRQAGLDTALPPLQARLTAGQLLAGTRSFPEVTVIAEATRGGAAMQLQSAGLSGTVRWPGLIDAEHPAVVHLARFDMAQPADSALGAQLALMLAPATQLQVDDLRWQGRALGSFVAELAAHDDELDASGLHLSGASGETRASAHCRPAACDLKFSVDSPDAAATLAAAGLRPDISAQHAVLEGDLHWSPQAVAPLATLGGHLHMQLEEGTTRAAAEGGGAPFALLSVPALLAGMIPEAVDASPPGLHFAQLVGNYELRDGEATTADLHFDGDAEILVRGRVGLNAGDYDEEAWILRGEDRLPAAVRRLGPTPRVAALWLSLRELLAGAPADRTRAALRLRGTWNDPIVTPEE